MKKRRPTDGMTLLEIAEASLHRVRLAPIDVLTPYYIGSLPFVLAFLYFWADMIQGAFGYRHVDTSALAVAVAYVWMKCWQTVYCAKMRQTLRGRFRHVARAGSCVLSRRKRFSRDRHVARRACDFGAFGTAYASIKTTVFSRTKKTASWKLRNAWTEARRWPKQNHQVIWLFSPMPLTIAAGLMLVVIPLLQALRADWSAPFLYQMVTVYTVVMVWLSPIGILVAYNVGMMIYMVPFLLQSLLGIETAVSMGGNFFNSTFFAICVGVAALCLDPVLKAAYTLRCFHGESLSSGEDLRIALRRIIASKGARTGMTIAVALAAFALPAGACAGRRHPPSWRNSTGRSPPNSRRANTSGACPRRFRRTPSAKTF